MPIHELFRELDALELQDLNVLFQPPIERHADLPGPRKYFRVLDGGFIGECIRAARGVALDHTQRFEDGALMVSWLSAADFSETGALESYSEGVIDHLRAVEGTKVAALVRQRLGRDDGARKVSLRATDDEVDVSRIARAQGGGGHRRAAGFTTQLADAELLAFLRAALAEQLA